MEAAIDNSTLDMAVRIVSSYVGKNECNKEQIGPLLVDIHKTIANLQGGGTLLANHKPAVPIDKSVTDDYIICLEDGVQLQMLKRYIRTQYNLTPEEYRRRWNLPGDYPMTAPGYSKRRSKLAKDSGLGTHPLAGRKANKTTKKKAATKKAATKKAS